MKNIPLKCTSRNKNNDQISINQKIAQKPEGGKHY